MKTLIFVLLIGLTACGENSSPEGRLTNKLDEVHKQLDQLDRKNEQLSDSISQIKKELKVLQSR